MPAVLSKSLRKFRRLKAYNAPFHYELQPVNFELRVFEVKSVRFHREGTVRLTPNSTSDGADRLRPRAGVSAPCPVLCGGWNLQGGSTALGVPRRGRRGLLFFLQAEEAEGRAQRCGAADCLLQQAAR